MTGLAEQQTEWIINNNLVNKGWCLDNDGNKNVYFQKPPYPDQQKKLKGKKPDYILYRSGTETPIAIIEAKKGGVDLQPALRQGSEYAEALGAPLVFAMNGSYCETRYIPNGKSLFLNGDEVRELVREAEALQFLEKQSNEVYTIPKEIVVSREDLIRIFKNLNDTLRSEGLRAGIERFSEFANILFLKLLSENNKKSWWSSIKAQSNDDIIEYVNGVVISQIRTAYHGDVFTPLLIKNPKTLRHIIDSLDPLVLSTIGTDVKGDAFEYFLEKTTSTENDLGEYFTPRNVVKTVINLIDPKFKETVYDPFCGTGGFLTGAFHHIKENNVIEDADLPRLQEKTFYGREITTTARIAKMNMILHGDGHSGVEQTDSLANPMFFDDGKPLKFDTIVTNMPFSQTITRKAMVDGKPKTQNTISPLYYNGIAKNNGDAACVLHCLQSLKEGGRMALIVPEGFLFRKQIANVREFLLSKAKLQSVISLPLGTFLPYTPVKTDILYFTDAHKANNQKEYWFFDAKNIGVTLDNHRKKIKGMNDFNKIESSDIKKVDKNPTLKPQMLEIGFKLIDMEKVRNNDYKLAGHLYAEAKKRTDCEHVKLGDKRYFEVVSGGTPDTTNPVYWDEGNINWATLVDLPDGDFITRINDTARKITKEGLDASSAKLIPVGSVVVSTRATLGRVGIVRGRPLTTNQGFKNVILNNAQFIPEYVAYAIRGQKEKLDSLASGTTFAEISKADFETIEIPLLDLDEQRMLVQEMESYESLIAGGKNIISHWKPRINDDKRGKPVRMSEIVTLDPKVRGDIDSNMEVSFVPMEYLQCGLPDFSATETKLYKEIGAGYTYFADGDILLAKITPCFENGKSAIARNLKNGTGFGSTEFIVIRPNTDRVNPLWIYYTIASNEFIESGKRWMVGTTGRQRLVNDYVMDYIMPLPTLEEQAAILADVQREYAIIEGNIAMVKKYEQKAKERLAKLWEPTEKPENPKS